MGLFVAGIVGGSACLGCWTCLMGLFGDVRVQKQDGGLDVLIFDVVSMRSDGVILGGKRSEID